MALRYFKTSGTQPQRHSNIAGDLNVLLRTHIHFVMDTVYEERSYTVYNNLKL